MQFAVMPWGPSNGDVGAIAGELERIGPPEPP